MKVKIVSDGTTEGTSIVNAETGECIDLIVQKIEWTADCSDNKSNLTTAILHVRNVELDVTVDAEVIDLAEKSVRCGGIKADSRCL